MIPLSAPDIGPAEIEAVLDVLRTPNLSLGPRIAAFEEALAPVSGVAHAVAVNSGTSALHLAVRALGLGEGDEVITTPFTFVATVNCLLYERVRPVFVDVDPTTRNIDPARIESAVTARTRAILPVHVFGRPCDMAPILEVAERCGLAVLEDACEAIGATYRGRLVGSFGRAATFSFYPNKQLTTGEGGAVVTDSPVLADACRRMRNHGRLAGGPLVHRELGFNYRMSDLHAALGLAQLARLDEILAARARVAEWYADGLRDVPGIRVPLDGEGLTVSWFVYVVELSDPRLAARREAVITALRDRGIGCGTYFPPVHLQPFHRTALGHRPGDFPAAEGLATRLLALPFFTRLSRQGVDEVCATLGEVLGARGGARRRPVAPAAGQPGDGGASASPAGAGSETRALLDRPEVEVDLSRAAERLARRVVLVTGAAGAIGAEICRQVAATDPATLVALDRSESALYRLELELGERWPRLRVEPLLLDVLHARAVRDAIQRLRPAVVFHAAAYKHVPVLERHPAEGVRNNVGGTLNVARAAQAAGVERFVFVSTDKAKRPASVLGASKRAAEMLLQCLAEEPDGGLDFVTVRFGNVIDSGGNVVERFREQIARGGPVTVTHAEMRRYFMTAAEAARLVLHASAAGTGGDVLLLEVGGPHGIMDLARRMIRLAAPGVRHVEIALGRPRPGDKLTEDYDLAGLRPLPPTSPQILRAALPAIDPERSRPALKRLLRLAGRGADAEVVGLLARLVPDYRPATPTS
jgi:perosamine synthetase